jgi:hypothetical protein
MSIMRAILLFFLLIVFGQCNKAYRNEPPFPDEKYYFSYNGIISIEAENANTLCLWTERDYYTGIGLRLNEDEALSNNFATYTVYFEKPGAYFLHHLGNRKRNTDISNNIIQYALLNQKEEEISNALLSFHEINAPAWSHNDPSTGSSAFLEVPEAGLLTMKLSAVEGNGMYVDKIVLSRDESFSPTGIGPEETLSSQPPDGRRNDIVLPPHWAFGVLYGGYTNHDQTLEVVDSLIQGGFPIDAYWIDSYFWDFNEGNGPGGYIDFIGDTIAFPDNELLWTELEKRNIKAGIWIWNLIQKDGNETAFREFEENNFFSTVYTNRNGWHNETKNTLAGVVDFENEAASNHWKMRLKPFFDKGLDFLKLDNLSDIPFCRAAFTATQELGKETRGRGFILAHLHSTYDYRHKLYPTKWSGDAKIAWTQPDYPDMGQYAMGGLKENIEMVADPKRSTYEIPFLSHDAGGYNYFGSKDQSDELYVRWTQFSSMNSIMMFFSANHNPTRNHPYRYPDSVQNVFRKYSKLRMQLFPYIYSYAIRSHLTGQKMIKGDSGTGLQYLFGDEILVAPVVTAGTREQTLHLPDGRWVDPETGMHYTGNQEVTIDAPLSTLPMLIREGAIIPMRPYASSIEAGSNDTLILDIYPSEEPGEFFLYEDDGLSNAYLDGEISSTRFQVSQKKNRIEFIVDEVSGSYAGINPRRYYMLKIHTDQKPGKVYHNKKAQNSGWTYISDEKLMLFNFAADKSAVQKVKIEF